MTTLRRSELHLLKSPAQSEAVQSEGKDEEERCVSWIIGTVANLSPDSVVDSGLGSGFGLEKQGVSVAETEGLLTQILILYVQH